MVVEEALGADRPCVGSGVGGLDDDVQDVRRDGGVEPRDDALIDLGPLNISEHH